MRVLHLRSSGGYGGAESVLRYLLPALTGLGVTCGLVISHRPDCAPFVPEALGECCWDVVDRRRLDLDMLREVSGLVRAFRPDVLHSHDYKSNLIAWWLKRTYKVSIVATVHGYTGATRLLQVYEQFDRAVVVPRFDAVTSPVRGEGYHTIFNGIDPDDVLRRSQPAAEWASSDEFRLISIGRASREKGHDVLATALSGLNDRVPWRWALVGDGPLLPQLVWHIKQAGMAHRVVLAGYLENPLPMLAAADALVLPSYAERCPLVVLEAMALGKVVLASAVGALPYLVGQGETGWLVPPGDPIACQEALSVAWHKRECWGDMGRLARKMVENSFHIAATARQYLEVYRSVVP
jgi:glycosyltransferase involved in cell wall biosynthesis